MDARHLSRAELRVHEELFRAQVETGFSLAHVAELAYGRGDAAEAKQALAEGRDAIGHAKRLLGALPTEAADEHRAELALLEFELHDLEIRSETD